jgi:hypothetical protein
MAVRLVRFVDTQKVKVFGLIRHGLYTPLTYGIKPTHLGYIFVGGGYPCHPAWVVE